ncbi:hypothetical protein [Microcoleus sp. AT3-D2]|uniref:hypothetical protein n=1 Tax=Microcoleus sp. AT3-D2 TaxID=2818612 RepID=UPI002FD18EED
MLKSVLSVDMRSHSGILGTVEVLRFWFGFSFPKIEVLVAIAELIAVFEISQQIPSDCLQHKFPAFRVSKVKKFKFFKLADDLIVF